LPSEEFDKGGDSPALFISLMKSLNDIVRPVRGPLARFEKAYARQFGGAVEFPDALIPGKRLRPLLFFLCQGLVGKPSSRSVPLAVLIELLHAASLIHDDVVDGAHRRRGTPSFAARKGSRLSVLTGDYLMAKALSLGVASGDGGVLFIVSEAVLEMTRAELLQNALENSERSNAETYYRIVRGKTASLFAAAGDLAGMVQEASPEDRKRMRRFGETFGTAFQIRDDILDFTGNPARLGKPVGLDLHNGQFTLPFLLALETVSPEERKAILKNLSSDPARSRQRIFRFVRERNGAEKAVAEADRRTDRSRRILSVFPRSVYRQALEDLLNYEGGRTA
jgi:octaprenyl-diphosphate synthase